MADRGSLTRRIGTILLIVGGLLAVSVFGFTTFVAGYKGIQYRCLVEGPSSPLAEVSERSGIVQGHLSLWPLGRSCEWARADGKGTVMAYPSWTNTFIVGSGLAIAAGGVALTIVGRARRRG